MRKYNVTKSQQLLFNPKISVFIVYHLKFISLLHTGL